MKHRACAVLLFIGFSLYGEVVIADKSERVGRFSYEDSFDENLVEAVLKNSSAAVKRNVKRLLYPDAEQQEMQRLLLLGGESNASTTAIAKAIAARCGYEYYLIEASALVQAYREGRQALLNEVRPIIKQDTPIAIIITELPEMADYSGVLASTLWLLIDQCAQYQDVFVIATSTFQKGQLSEEIKERFAGDIISVALDKPVQDRIEHQTNKKMSWLERNKGACIVAAGLAVFALGIAHLYVQMLFADAQAEREGKQILFAGKMIALYEQMLFIQKDGQGIQEQQYDMQKKQLTQQVQEYALQKQQHRIQYDAFLTQMSQLNIDVRPYDMENDKYNGYVKGLSQEKQQSLKQRDENNRQVVEDTKKRFQEFSLA